MLTVDDNQRGTCHRLNEKQSASTKLLGGRGLTVTRALGGARGRYDNTVAIRSHGDVAPYDNSLVVWK